MLLEEVWGESEIYFCEWIFSLCDGAVGIELTPGQHQLDIAGTEPHPEPTGGVAYSWGWGKETTDVRQISTI